MSKHGQGTKWRRKIAENFNRLSRVHECYRRHTLTDDRQTTDGRAIAYSERERQFTFVKKFCFFIFVTFLRFQRFYYKKL